MGTGPSGLPPSIADAIAGVTLDSLDADEEKRDEEKLVRLLFKRIARAKKEKQKWELDFEVDRSHAYVKGFQRPEGEEKDAQGDYRYQINKILASLKAKIPRIFYYHPYVRVNGSRGREDTPAQTVSERAALLQDTINTIIREPSTHFKPACLAALKEAQWAFGVVETGYEAEWVENPFARKPVLVESEEARRDLEQAGAVPEEDSLEAAMQRLGEIPQSETFYVKHIPARQFLVASNARSETGQQDWVGYWEWVYLEDVKRTDSFRNTKDLKASAKMGEAGFDPDLVPPAARNEEIPPDMVRVWKLWDQRERKRYVLAEGHDAILKETEFHYLPLFDLRLEVMPGEWYPIPPVFSQLTEQDEFNDAREWLRLVRKGTRPRYTYPKSALTQEEIEKLGTDDFGTFVALETENPDPIRLIAQPSMSEAAVRTLALSEAGFSEQAGVSATDRLTRSSGGKPTAREVSSLEEKGDIRDSYEQQEVAEWVGALCTGILRCAIEKMTLPRWVLINSDPHSPLFLQDAAQIVDRYKEITADQLEDADALLRWDVTVDIESMSPVSEATQAQRILQALNMLANPGVGRLLSLSMPLLKKILNMMGIRSESDQRAIVTALEQRDALEREAAAAGAPGAPGVSPLPGAPSPTPAGPGGPMPLPPSVQQAMARARGMAAAPPSAAQGPGPAPAAPGGSVPQPAGRPS